MFKILVVVVLLFLFAAVAWPLLARFGKELGKYFKKAVEDMSEDDDNEKGDK